MTHVPMNAHPYPRKVLVIGGGDGGVLREVVKHEGVEEVTLCEIDEVNFIMETMTPDLRTFLLLLLRNINTHITMLMWYTGSYPRLQEIFAKHGCWIRAPQGQDPYW